LLNIFQLIVLLLDLLGSRILDLLEHFTAQPRTAYTLALLLRRITRLDFLVLYADYFGLGVQLWAGGVIGESFSAVDS